MCPQRRKHPDGCRRAIDVGQTADEQFDGCRQSRRHGRWLVAGEIALARFRLQFHFQSHLGVGQCPLQQLGLTLVLRTIAGRLDGVAQLLLVFAIVGQYPLYPRRVVVAHIAQITGHDEQEIVSCPVGRNTTQLLGQSINDERVGDAVEIVG